MRAKNPHFAAPPSGNNPQGQGGRPPREKNAKPASPARPPASPASPARPAGVSGPPSVSNTLIIAAVEHAILEAAVSTEGRSLPAGTTRRHRRHRRHDPPTSQRQASTRPPTTPSAHPRATRDARRSQRGPGKPPHAQNLPRCHPPEKNLSLTMRFFIHHGRSVALSTSAFRIHL